MREPERDTLCPIIEKDAGRHQTKVASHTATPLGQGFKWGVASTSHFAVPIGTAVWLATIV